jgi:hypothetical protein
MVLAMLALPVDTVSLGNSPAIHQQFTRAFFTAMYALADQVVHKTSLVEVQQKAYELSNDLKHLINVSSFLELAIHKQFTSNFPQVEWPTPVSSPASSSDDAPQRIGFANRVPNIGCPPVGHLPVAQSSSSSPPPAVDRAPSPLLPFRTKAGNRCKPCVTSIAKHGELCTMHRDLWRLHHFAPTPSDMDI